MNEQFYIGIDNGVSGGISVIDKNCQVRLCEKIPIVKKLYFTKAKKYFNHIDFIKLKEMIEMWSPAFCYIERPMVNRKFFNTALSAIMAYEITTLALEQTRIGFDTIDSKLWQRYLLPAKLKGAELKKASMQTAKRLFPKVDIKTDGQADSLLIAEFLRRTR